MSGINLIYSQRPSCVQCISDQFTLNQNEPCQKCIEGGICINGSLFNMEGK